MVGCKEGRRATRRWNAVTHVVLAAGVLIAGVTVNAQTAGAAANDAAEQRRAQEREQSRRLILERQPQERPAAPAPVPLGALPDGETGCLVIRQLELRGEEAGRFGWILDAAAGPDGKDSPLRKCLGTTGIDLVLQRIQAALQTKGYVTTRVLAQEQQISAGTLVLTILPGRINAIRFADGSGQRGSIGNSVPAQPGDILNVHDIEQALENFRRLPTAKADIRIASVQGAAPNLSDLVITHSQAAPFRMSVSADDSGTRSTGKYQGAITLSYDNWWTLSDLFYITLNHDLGGGSAGYSGTRGGVVHYSVPMGHWLLGATLSRSRYAQTVAGASQDYVYSGTSRSAEVKLSRLVHRSAAGKATASLKAFQRQSASYIDDTEIQVQRRIVGGWEIAVGHRGFIGKATLEANAAYRRGTGAFGAKPAPEEAFGEGTARFALVTADAHLSAPFELASQRFRYTANWRGQTHRTALTPQDRFAIGGRYTVRGFDGESTLSAERGWLLRNELGVVLGESQHELYAGLDHGRVAGPSSQGLVGTRLSGAVVGLRGAVKGLQYDLFASAPLSRPSGFDTAPITLGFQLNYSL